MTPEGPPPSDHRDDASSAADDLVTDGGDGERPRHRWLLVDQNSPEVARAFEKLRSLVDASGRTRVAIAADSGLNKVLLTKILNPKKYSAIRSWDRIQDILRATGSNPEEFATAYGYLWGLETEEISAQLGEEGSKPSTESSSGRSSWPQESLAETEQTSTAQALDDTEFSAEKTTGRKRFNWRGKATPGVIAMSALLTLVVAVTVQTAGDQPLVSTGANPYPRSPILPQTTTATTSSLPPLIDTRPIGTRPVQLSSIAVYDPSGNPDNPGPIGRANDFDYDTSWQTNNYNAQFPVPKPGIGIMTTMQLSQTELARFDVRGTPGTRFEIRTAPAANVPLRQTTLLGATTVDEYGLGRVEVGQPPPSTNQILVWIVGLAESDGNYASAITELAYFPRIGLR